MVVQPLLDSSWAISRHSVVDLQGFVLSDNDLSSAPTDRLLGPKKRRKVSDREGGNGERRKRGRDQ